MYFSQYIIILIYLGSLELYLVGIQVLKQREVVHKLLPLMIKKLVLKIYYSIFSSIYDRDC